MASKDEVVFCYDSIWDHRYEGRSQNLLEEAEKVYRLHGKSFFSKEDHLQDTLLGEFVGVVLFKQKMNSIISDAVVEITQKNPRATILELLNHVDVTSCLNSIDLKGDWAELDSSQDMNTFQFGTKADTLEMLRSKLQKSIVLMQHSFTVQEWRDDKNGIIKLLQDKFYQDKSIVVRSSAISEDTGTSSMAGNFESILNVDVTDKLKIETAIGKVVTSYQEKELEQCLDNQVFIQPFLSDTDISGVAFTRDMETKAPYYVINFDDVSKKTDTVTSGTGSSLKTFIINKFECETDIPWLKVLLDVLKEIEMVTHDDFLDIEFAIKDNNVTLLQVRPIAAHKNELRVADNDFIKATASIKEFVKNKTKSKQVDTVGNRTAYGIMPDWNPAEIIGISPKPLALSLYKELITDNVWPKSRAHIGYMDVGNNIGMVSLGGRSYIDIRVSLNTFIPQSLNADISAKLVDFYISYLEENQHLHDKVEFDVALTTYTFDHLQLNKHLQKGSFSNEDSIEIIESLRVLTKEVLENKKYNIDSIMSDLNILEAQHLEINKSHLSQIEKIHHLISDCKAYGTYQFSILARFAFMANILLKSLVSIGVLKESRFHKFFETISTIPKMLLNDMGTMDFENLVDKYGHLRPGTYDIESKSYRENDSVLQNTPDQNIQVTDSFSWSDQEIKDINHCLEKAGFELEFTEFIDFITKAIEAREFAKFSFTKSISSVLDNCISLGENLGIQRSEMSFLKINDILNYYGGSVSFNQHGELVDQINYNKKQFLLTHSIKLPPLIFSEKDVDCHLYESDEPNFITNIKCFASVIELTGNEDTLIDLSGRIVLIEKADPGFDWLFSHNIKGLITQYGGIASHMAIRCAELSLPAAIGCGALVYKFVTESNSIELDCSSRQIRRVS